MKYLAAILIGLLLFRGAPVFAAEWEGKTTSWKGYQRVTFEMDGKTCHVTLPKKPAAGNPWVWRARFPNYHPETDLLLLQRGFHVAHMNTGGMLGSPRALNHWDKFYEKMTKEHLMAKKVALEAVSRGGLFAYRWAARHPERVACIYADVPVCDFKSWPLRNGTGGDRLWQHLLKEYGLTHEQALSYRENPIDVLAPLAKAKIPLLHLVSLNDKIVPAEENTFILAKRYRELGGKINIIEVKEGTKKSSGHHLTHPDPKRTADFISEHADIPKPLTAFHRRIAGHQCSRCLPPLP